MKYILIIGIVGVGVVVGNYYAIQNELFRLLADVITVGLCIFGFIKIAKSEIA